MLEKIKEKFPIYAIAIAVPLVIGVAAALITRGDMEIYEKIVKPPLAPPALLFPIVWSILYILMGVSSGLVYDRRREAPEAAQRGLTNYAMSLVFNFFWSIFFFKLQLYLLSFVWLLLMLYLIIRTIIEYWRVSRAAAIIQIPYAVWVAFAGYLNCAIWILNT